MGVSNDAAFYVEAGGGAAPVSITHAALNGLIGLADLVPGAVYEVTDYMDGLFDPYRVFVKAIDIDTLALEADIYPVAAYPHVQWSGAVQVAFGQMTVFKINPAGSEWWSQQFTLLPILQIIVSPFVNFAVNASFTPPTDPAVIFNRITVGDGTVDLSGATAGCEVAFVRIVRGSLSVTGNSLVYGLTIENQASLQTDGFDVTNVMILTGNHTLTADNVDTYAGFGLDTIV